MTKRRARPAAPAPVAAPPPPDTTRFLRWEGPLFVGIAAVLVIALGYLSRKAMNPDGVSYLDLADAVRRGDWTHLVQGYWSPLLPLIAGAAGGVLGLGHSASIALVHGINVDAAIIALGILFVWARRIESPTMLVGSVAAFFLASAGMPRLEAVTPDIILFAVMIALSYELAFHHGRRSLVTGILLGAAYLVKTSCWPWLVVTLVVRLFAARDRDARTLVLRSTGISLIVMALWIVPLSIKSGRPTLGSSGRLNYSWYIDANTSRLPDVDLGGNGAYREVRAPNNQLVTVATFNDAAYWTYQPWGDPTSWAQQVTTETGGSPTVVALIAYWLRQSGRIIGLWLLPMVVTVLLPIWYLRRRDGLWRDALGTDRDAAVVTVLGTVGVLQFAAIHAEPRLIAPFAMMLALGALQWWCRPAAVPMTTRLPRSGQLAMMSIGLVAGVAFAVPKFVEGVTSAARLDVVTEKLEEVRARLGTGDAPIDVAIVGPAAPVLSAAYLIGAHITGQVLPRSARIVESLPTEQKSALLTQLFGSRAVLVWESQDDGAMQMLLLPRS
ncbi:MAG TPA: hypothetical protein VGM20_09965 [Gemmatimonadales bacterium]|jgi:hypothetical protein